MWIKVETKKDLELIPPGSKVLLLHNTSAHVYTFYKIGNGTLQTNSKKYYTSTEGLETPVDLELVYQLGFGYHLPYSFVSIKYLFGPSKYYDTYYALSNKVCLLSGVV